MLSIQWLNASNSGALLAISTSGQQQLVMEIERVTRDINNTQYSFSVPLYSLATGTDYKYVIHCWNKFDSVGITSKEMSFRTSDSGELRHYIFIHCLRHLYYIYIYHRVWACERISYNIS